MARLGIEEQSKRIDWVNSNSVSVDGVLVIPKQSGAIINTWKRLGITKHELKTSNLTKYLNGLNPPVYTLGQLDKYKNPPLKQKNRVIPKQGDNIIIGIDTHYLKTNLRISNKHSKTLAKFEALIIKTQKDTFLKFFFNYEARQDISGKEEILLTYLKDYKNELIFCDTEFNEVLESNGFNFRNAPPPKKGESDIHYKYKTNKTSTIEGLKDVNPERMLGTIRSLIIPRILFYKDINNLDDKQLRTNRLHQLEQARIYIEVCEEYGYTVLEKEQALNSLSMVEIENIEQVIEVKA